MDEAEKYKQRLEAIAEKRRLQEEEDKARREMEDEKLRLQQLKRKSLRDQWLMETAPLSPTSPMDAQAPRSPLWNTHAQDMKKNTDKLAEEPEEATEEVVKAAGDVKEVVQRVTQNGENSNGSFGFEENGEGKAQVNPRPAADERSIDGNPDANAHHNASDLNSQSTVNGLVGITKAVGDVTLEQQSSVDEPGRAGNDKIRDEEEEEEEEEEGTLVMRAECVIITDEGDNASQEDRPDDVQQENETSLINVREGKEEDEAEEELGKAKMFTESEKDEVVELSPYTQPAAGNGDVEASKMLRQNGEGTVEHQDIQVGNSASVRLHFSASPPEGTVGALVPFFSEEQPSTTGSVPQGQESAAPEGAGELARQSNEFQDVSLAEPRQNRTDGRPGEQDPLLTAGSARIHSAATTDTESPTRGQGPADKAKESNRKDCRCCSVM